MARYDYLSIYKAALDMTVHSEELVASFSQYHKYTLGTELHEGNRAVLQQVPWATNEASLHVTWRSAPDADDPARGGAGVPAGAVGQEGGRLRGGGLVDHVCGPAR